MAKYPLKILMAKKREIYNSGCHIETGLYTFQYVTALDN